VNAHFTTDSIKETLHQVESDEAAAIDALCALLEHVEKSRNVDCLPAVREVMKEWQNRPPGVIVRSLMEISKRLDA
jgi:hypothetical protein